MLGCIQPMSSPMMNTMLGLAPAVAPAVAVAAAAAKADPAPRVSTAKSVSNLKRNIETSFISPS
ncbi:MAG: hypothetical protein AW10_04297 [Candidatus Accumulibacter appositus]|uniref:Uncharacterized protein n=1 Tax=Candidatus Accumulibacter appositus TaxID=1454003 RepID=A0A011P0H3_9PROT|nr:MAG: hypothetical protein AW10_04297 [Candidatus Accumulibacter appositus]